MGPVTNSNYVVMFNFVAGYVAVYFAVYVAVYAVPDTIRGQLFVWSGHGGLRK
jgi:hypothetical protein